MMLVRCFIEETSATFKNLVTLFLASTHDKIAFNIRYFDPIPSEWCISEKTRDHDQ
jgi:hypothetical protein